MKSYSFGYGIEGCIGKLTFCKNTTFNIWQGLAVITMCWLENDKLVISGINFLSQDDKEIITKALRDFEDSKTDNNSMKYKYVAPCGYCNGTGYTTQTIWSGVGKQTFTSKCNHCNQ